MTFIKFSGKSNDFAIFIEDGTAKCTRSNSGQQSLDLLMLTVFLLLEYPALSFFFFFTIGPNKFGIANINVSCNVGENGQQTIIGCQMEKTIANWDALPS